MSDEIRVKRATGLTLYVALWRPKDLFVWDDTTDNAFETALTWNDAHVQDCAIALVEIAGTGWYQGDMPDVPASTYYLTIYEQAGGSPDMDDDTHAGGYEIHWTGTGEITLLDAASHNKAYLD